MAPLSRQKAQEIVRKWKQTGYKGVTLEDLEQPVQADYPYPLVFVVLDEDPRSPLFNRKEVLKLMSPTGLPVAIGLAVKFKRGMLDLSDLPKAIFDPEVLNIRRNLGISVAHTLVDAYPDIELPEEAYFYRDDFQLSVAHEVALKGSPEALLRIPDKALFLTDADGISVAHYIVNRLWLESDPEIISKLIDKLAKPGVLTLPDNDGVTVADKLLQLAVTDLLGLSVFG